MPNMNPAGPFQPMSAHPVPYNWVHTVGMDSTLVKATGPGEYLLVPASPDPSVIRYISNINGLRVQNAGAVPVTVTLYAKDEQDRRYVLNEFLLAPGFAEPVLDIPSFYLTEGRFTGLYASFPEASDNVVFFSPYQDRRYIQGKKTEIVNSVKPVLPAVEEGNAAFMAEDHLVPERSIAVFNFSSAPVDIVLSFILDGEDYAFQAIGPVPPSPDPGVVAIAFDLANFTTENLELTAFPPGASLGMNFLVPTDPDFPVEVIAYTTLTNLGPVKTYQGGAY